MVMRLYHCLTKYIPHLFVHFPVGGREEGLYAGVIIHDPAWTLLKLYPRTHVRASPELFSRARPRHEIVEFLRTSVFNFSTMQKQQYCLRPPPTVGSSPVQHTSRLRITVAHWPPSEGHSRGFCSGPQGGKIINDLIWACVFRSVTPPKKNLRGERRQAGAWLGPLSQRGYSHTTLLRFFEQLQVRV